MRLALLMLWAKDHALGALDVVGKVILDQAAHDERLEKFERHLLG